MVRWTKPKTSTRPVSLEAFSGGGLLALALAVEGMNSAGICEVDKEAISTLKNNAHELNADPSSIVACDVKKWKPQVKPGEVDLFCGGPPCQPFSVLKSIQGGLRGEDDPRSKLLWSMIRLAKLVRPRVMVVENVRGILSKSFKKYIGRPGKGVIDTWWHDLEAINYEGVIWELKACDYGTPQQRSRVFMVCWPMGAPWGEALRSPPPPTHADPRAGRFRELGLLPWTRAFDRLNDGCCGGYGYSDCLKLMNIQGACERCFWGSQYESLPDNSDNAVDLSEGGRKYLGRLGERMKRYAMPLDQGGAMAAYHPDEMGRRVVGPWLAPVITAGHGAGLPFTATSPGFALDIDDIENQDMEVFESFSVRQAAKLQDLPQWYILDRNNQSFRSLLRQIGNGVPVSLGRAVARHVMRSLGYPAPFPGSHAHTQALNYSVGLWPINGITACPWYGMPGEVKRVPPNLLQGHFDFVDDDDFFREADYWNLE